MLPHSSLRVLVLASLFALGGCSDAAKPKFDECVKLEADWEIVKARDACKAAAEAAPNSKSGKAAAAKLGYLNEKADKLVAEQQKKDAPCKGKWVTRCMYQGKPRPTLLTEGTYAACTRSADQVRVIGMTCPECVCEDRFVEPYPDAE